MGTEAKCVMHSLGCGRKAELVLEIKPSGNRDFSKVFPLKELVISRILSISETNNRQEGWREREQEGGREGRKGDGRGETGRGIMGRREGGTLRESEGGEPPP